MQLDDLLKETEAMVRQMAESQPEPQQPKEEAEDLYITDPAEIQSIINRYSKPRRVWEDVMFLTSDDEYAASVHLPKVHQPLRKVLDSAMGIARRKVAWEGAAIAKIFLCHYATKYGKTVVAELNEDCTEITAILVG